MHPMRIVGTGLIALDVVLEPDLRTTGCALGGSAGNVISILGALGWKATPVCTLGDDEAGEHVFDELLSINADLRLVTRSADRSTPVVYQHQAASKCDTTHRFSFACPFCGAARRPAWVEDPSLVQAALTTVPSTDVFFFDRSTQLACELAEAYAATGALVVFEPSAIGSSAVLFERAVKSAHVVKYAEDRLADISAFDLRSSAIEIQTMGRRGLRYRIPSLADDWLNLGAYEIPFVEDTSGAGDWCTAGMIYDLFSKGPVPLSVLNYTTVGRALAFGQALSSLNCMARGARGLFKVLPTNKIITTGRKLSEARIKHLARVPGDLGMAVDGAPLSMISSDPRWTSYSRLSLTTSAYNCPH